MEGLKEEAENFVKKGAEGLKSEVAKAEATRNVAVDMESMAAGMRAEEADALGTAGVPPRRSLGGQPLYYRKETNSIITAEEEKGKICMSA